MKKICIIGAGGHAKEVLLVIHELGRMGDVACFMEPDNSWTERDLLGVPVRPMSEFDPAIHSAIIGIGDSKIREKVVDELPDDTEYETLISPRALWSPWNEIGEGTVIFAGAIVTVDVKVGKHVIINWGAAIGHDVVIEDYVTITPHVTISGHCHLGRHSYWGTQSNIHQCLTVCPYAVVGMSAVVTKNITEPGVYVGVPAHKVK